MPLLASCNYRGLGCDYLVRDPPGGAADLTGFANGVFRVRAFEKPVRLAQAPGTAVELAGDLPGHLRQERLQLRRRRHALTHHAAPHVLEDLDEGDPVGVKPPAAGQAHDDPGQAVVHSQMRPHLLAYQFGGSRAQHLLRTPLERLDLRYEASASHLWGYSAASSDAGNSAGSTRSVNSLTTSPPSTRYSITLTATPPGCAPFWPARFIRARYVPSPSTCTGRLAAHDRARISRWAPACVYAFHSATPGKPRSMITSIPAALPAIAIASPVPRRCRRPRPHRSTHVCRSPLTPPPAPAETPRAGLLRLTGRRSGPGSQPCPAHPGRTRPPRPGASPGRTTRPAPPGPPARPAGGTPPQAPPPPAAAAPG